MTKKTEKYQLQIDEYDQAVAALRRRMPDDLVLFAEELIIPSASGPKRFGDCMAPFQRECFGVLAPSLLAVKNGTEPSDRRFWIERTKKAAKDADLAVCLLWLVAYTNRPFLVQVSAANRKQASIVKRRMRDLLYYNPWLKERVLIQVNRVLNIDRTVEVVIEATAASSAITKTSGGAHGDTPDILILNELVHVDRWETNEVHMHNATGVPRGIVMIFTNAGFKGSKADAWKKKWLKNPKRWKVKEWKGLAPWLNKEDVKEAEALDPMKTQYNRLWLGIWQSGKGDALDEEAIDRCFRASGYLDTAEEGWVYTAAVDLGVMHDHSGVAVVGVNTDEQRIRVVRVKGWAPSETNKDTGKLEVPLLKVEKHCRWLFDRFHPCWFGYDPAEGGRLLAQMLRLKGLSMSPVNFSSQKETGNMADALVYVVKSGLLECYEDSEGRLRRDLNKFSLVPKASALGGYKLEAISDEDGHADVGTAMVMCLPKALSLLGGYVLFDEDTKLAQLLLDDDEVTEEDLEDMPEHLREIYDDAGKAPDDFDDDW